MSKKVVVDAGRKVLGLSKGSDKDFTVVMKGGASLKGEKSLCDTCVYGDLGECPNEYETGRRRAHKEGTKCLICKMTRRGVINKECDCLGIIFCEVYVESVTELTDGISYRYIDEKFDLDDE